MLNRKFKIFIKLVIFILSIVISICLIMADFIILFKYTGKYEINDNLNNSFIREELEEIGANIPKETKIIKIKYERPWDICEYEITYIENEEEKVVDVADTERSELEQYIIHYGKNYDELILLGVFLIVIFQIVFPIICLVWLIKEIKRNKKEKKNNEEK